MSRAGDMFQGLQCCGVPGVRLRRCAAVKANSIKGNKLDNVTVVFTPARSPCPSSPCRPLL